MLVASGWTTDFVSGRWGDRSRRLVMDKRSHVKSEQDRVNEIMIKIALEKRGGANAAV
jgi:hypothetical protein